jgi:hypothetical protein
MPDSDGKIILDINAPVTDGDTNCDYSGLSAAVNQTSFMQKIKDAQARRESLSQQASEQAETNSANTATATGKADEEKKTIGKDTESE